MIEFALIAPVFFIMFTAAIDFARAAYTYEAMSLAVREGGREGIVASFNGTGSTDYAVWTQAQSYGVGLTLLKAPCLHGQSGSPITTPAPTTPNTGYIYILAVPISGTPNAPSGGGPTPPGCVTTSPASVGSWPLKLRVVYNFQPFTPFAAQFMSNGMTLTVDSTMYTEF